jgi:WD40 repeat protein
MIVLWGAASKIRALRFSPDGRTLVVPFPEGVQVWHDLVGGPPTQVLEHEGITSARFTPDGLKLLLCGPPVVLVDLSSQGEVSVPLELGDRPVCCDLSPDGRVLVLAQVPRPEGGINSWLNVTTRLVCRPLADLGSSLWSIVVDGRVTDPPLFLPGGEQFVTLERWPGARFVTRDSSTGVVLSAVVPESQVVLDSPVLSPDGAQIACYRGVQVAVYKVEALRDAPATFANDNPKQFTALAFHPSGRFLAATSNDSTVKLYDTVTWKMVQAFNWDVGRLRSIAFSPDGMLAAVGGDQGKIVVWDVDL